MAKLFTPKFRVSFPSVFKATQINGEGASRFRLSMIFDPKEIAKDPEEQKKWDAIQAAVDATAEAKWGNVPAKLLRPFKEGNTMCNSETGAVYDGHKDMIVLRTQSQDRPGLIDQNKQPIIEESEFYGGCYAIATISFYAWEHKMTGKGVSAGIQNIMKVAEGETFSGKSKAEDDFSAISAPAGNSDLFGE